jgi:hypothetical protein
MLNDGKGTVPGIDVSTVDVRCETIGLHRNSMPAGLQLAGLGCSDSRNAALP